MVYQAAKRFPNVRCGVCSRRDHTTNQCQERCNSCKRTGHWSKDCPRKLCYNCGQIGHIVTNCPNNTSEYCWTCGNRRSEVFLARQNKTIYYCERCRKGDN